MVVSVKVLLSSLTHLLLVVLTSTAWFTARILSTTHGQDDNEKNGEAHGEDGARGQGSNWQNGQSIGSICGRAGGEEEGDRTNELCITTSTSGQIDRDRKQCHGKEREGTGVSTELRRRIDTEDTRKSMAEQRPLGLVLTRAQVKRTRDGSRGGLRGCSWEVARKWGSGTLIDKWKWKLMFIDDGRFRANEEDDGKCRVVVVIEDGGGCAQNDKE